MSRNWKPFKISAQSGICFALFFSIFSLVFYFGDWQRFGLVFLMGLFVGLVAAPEFEPKLFKRAWLHQTVSGALVGVVFALMVDAYSMALTVPLGAMLGWLTPMWIKYVQIP